ncbi:MAG: tetratricopeptide repeat protein [Candidatus Freyarchaeum deiterrae]
MLQPLAAFGEDVVEKPYAEVHSNLGVALEALGDFKGAVEAYQNYVKFASPQHVERVK